MAKAWDLRRDMFLSETEVDRLLCHLHDRTLCPEGRARDTALLNELIVMSLILSGLRNSEFCALAVRDTIAGSGESVFRVRRPPARTVFVPQCVSAAVARYVEQQRPRFLPDDVSPGDQDQPLLFNERKRPFERTGLYRRVVKVLREAGLGARASVQLLRHTYGYLSYLRTGGNLLFVQRQLGHSHPRITSVYAQFVDESYADLSERVAGRPGSRTPAYAGGETPSGRPVFNCEID